jgi:hypothetical protein
MTYFLRQNIRYTSSSVCLTTTTPPHPSPPQLPSSRHLHADYTVATRPPHHVDTSDHKIRHQPLTLSKTYNKTSYASSITFFFHGPPLQKPLLYFIKLSRFLQEHTLCLYTTWAYWFKRLHFIILVSKSSSFSLKISSN